MNSLNGDEIEKVEHRKSLNPFATDEDDDSDDGEGDFTIGDLEVEEEGKGHIPTGTSLVGAEESLLHGSSDKNSSDEDSDEEYGSGKFGGDGQGRRRLSVTTEAKRRTSLEDDDEDEVLVHVAMEAPEEVKAEALGDDEELVEVQHAEMQGVEAGK